MEQSHQSLVLSGSTTTSTAVCLHCTSPRYSPFRIPSEAAMLRNASTTEEYLRARRRKRVISSPLPRDIRRQDSTTLQRRLRTWLHHDVFAFAAGSRRKGRHTLAPSCPRARRTAPGLTPAGHLPRYRWCCCTSTSRPHRTQTSALCTGLPRTSSP